MKTRLSLNVTIEVWIGDDDNYIPIKIRTKLIIGYAEVHYKSSVNLKKPLDYRVEIKKYYDYPQ